MTAPDDATALRLRVGPQVWRRMCRHLDGIAIGTTVAALDQAGIFDELARATGPLEIDALADAHQSPRGVFHLAMRLCEEQGWVEREGIAAGGRRSVRLTAAGSAWLPYVGAYAPAAAALDMAQDLFVALTRGNDFDPARLAPMVERIPIGEPIAERVRDHLWGPLAAAAVSGLKRSDGNGSARAAAFSVLRHVGWAEPHTQPALSDAGRLALEWAAQYDHSISYFPTFAAVPERLFPGTRPRAGAASGFDSHLDRRLDIDFSGNVFSHTCRDAFLALALPIFDASDIASQPAAIVDTGAGDGSLLRELFAAVRDRTRRGAALAAFPLPIVGVEPSPVAREVIARALAAVGASPIVIGGDIGDPDGIARQLASRGIDFATALHVSKSVIHDRSFRPPQAGEPPPLADPSWPPSDVVYVAEDDGLISHAVMQADLVGHFRKWLLWMRRHGMIAIEAHTVPARLIAAHEGGNVMAGLDASHGYSHQYLVERPVYLRAAAEAGLVAAASRELAAEMLGTPIIAIDHWRPAPPRRRSA